MHKENCNEEENEIPRDLLGGWHSYALHCIKTLNTSNQRHCRRKPKHSAPHAAAYATTENSENKSVITGFQFDKQ
jgi:hypothetical protein